MRGKIEIINSEKRLIAVRTENDEYSVMEIHVDFSLKLDDVLEGDIEILGEVNLSNITQKEKWLVNIVDVHVNREQAQKDINKLKSEDY